MLSAACAAFLRRHLCSGAFEHKIPHMRMMHRALVGAIALFLAASTHAAVNGELNRRGSICVLAIMQ